MKKGIRYIISTVFIELLQTARHCAKTLRFTSKKVIKKKKFSSIVEFIVFEEGGRGDRQQKINITNR